MILDGVKKRFDKVLKPKPEESDNSAPKPEEPAPLTPSVMMDNVQTLVDDLTAIMDDLTPCFPEKLEFLWA